MEKRSKHPIDVLRWIETVVDSCKTHHQVLVADNLIYKYRDMYIKDINSPLYKEWECINWKIVYKLEELDKLEKEIDMY